MAPIKVGPHDRGTPSQRVRDWTNVARIVKQIDRYDLLQAASGGSTTIYRKFYANQDLNRNGAEVANEVIDSLGGFRPTYIEAYNETAQRLGQGLERHVAFMWEFTNQAHSRGYKVCGFSFSTGNPEWDDWVYCATHGWGGCDVIGIHEYWGAQGFTENHALRHRRFHNGLAAAGYDVSKPWVIVECGRDRVWEGGDKRGWLDWGISAETFANEVKAYDSEIQKDGYILGAVLFTGGGAPDFSDFEIESVIPYLIGGSQVCQDPGCPAGTTWQGAPTCRCVDDTPGCQDPGCGTGRYWVGYPSCRCEDDLVYPPPSNTKVLVGAALFAGALLALAYVRQQQMEGEGEPPPPSGLVPVSEVIEVSEGGAAPPGYFRIGG